MTKSAVRLSKLSKAGKSELAREISRLERGSDTPGNTALLDAAWQHAKAQVIGITGPPGVGKSTLIGALLPLWREREERVAVLAIDPSSRRTGGALLGDRTRFDYDHQDQGIFVRSMAARQRLGGVAPAAFDAVILLRALFDKVVVETVGIGQSETDVEMIADTVVFCVQPGSGDSLQFMKSGIMEIPDIVAVTKADMEGAARRAAADVKSALHYRSESKDDWPIAVLPVSAAGDRGLKELIGILDEHEQWQQSTGKRKANRLDQGRFWLEERLRTRFGSEGVKKIAGDLANGGDASPFEREAALSKVLLGR